MRTRLQCSLPSNPCRLNSSARRHVYVLHADSEPLKERQLNFLVNCWSVENLCIDHHADLDLLRALGKLQPTKLSVFPEGRTLWFEEALTYPLFSSVTHLELLQDHSTMPPNYPSQLPKLLASLNALTHICLPQNVFETAWVAIATEIPALRALIAVLYIDPEDAVLFARGLSRSGADRRVVVLGIEDGTADWEHGSRGGDDMWIQADIFIEKKRKGEIAENCYCPDDLE